MPSSSVEQSPLPEFEAAVEEVEAIPMAPEDIHSAHQPPSHQMHLRYLVVVEGTSRGNKDMVAKTVAAVVAAAVDYWFGLIAEVGTEGTDKEAMDKGAFVPARSCLRCRVG